MDKFRELRIEFFVFVVNGLENKGPEDDVLWAKLLLAYRISPSRLKGQESFVVHNVFKITEKLHSKANSWCGIGR